jgi:UTP-glucose-1-phosphate uridylyltransferase
MIDLTLIILAAGIGKRYGGLKQIEPVGPNNEIILHYSAFDAIHSGFNKIIVVLQPGMLEGFRQIAGKKLESTCETTYVFQDIHELPENNLEQIARDKPWGTGHAVWCCRNAVDSPFAVINADDFYGRRSFLVMADFLHKKSIYENTYGLVGFRVENTLSKYGTVARAVCSFDNTNTLVRIEERTHIKSLKNECAYLDEDNEWIKLETGTIVSMNFWGFTPTIFTNLEKQLRFFLDWPADKQTEFYLPNAVGNLIRNKQANVTVLPSYEKWFGITYPDDMSSVRTALRELHTEGVYPPKLFEELA